LGFKKFCILEILPCSIISALKKRTVYILKSYIPTIMANGNGWECDSVWPGSFDVGDDIEPVEIIDSHLNVLNAE
jgi:hypothetical protein